MWIFTFTCLCLYFITVIFRCSLLIVIYFCNQPTELHAGVISEYVSHLCVGRWASQHLCIFDYFHHRLSLMELKVCSHLLPVLLPLGPLCRHYVLWWLVACPDWLSVTFSLLLHPTGRGGMYLVHPQKWHTLPQLWSGNASPTNFNGSEQESIRDAEGCTRWTGCKREKMPVEKSEPC